MNVLVAFCKEEMDEVVATIQNSGEYVFTAKSLRNLDEGSVEKTRIAFIDEDFDGMQTGWVLAAEIRKTAPLAKIIMVVRTNVTIEKLPLYDSVVGYPATVEELIGELRRKV